MQSIRKLVMNQSNCSVWNWWLVTLSELWQAQFRFTLNDLQGSQFLNSDCQSTLLCESSTNFSYSVRNSLRWTFPFQSPDCVLTLFYLFLYITAIGKSGIRLQHLERVHPVCGCHLLMFLNAPFTLALCLSQVIIEQSWEFAFIIWPSQPLHLGNAKHASLPLTLHLFTHPSGELRENLWSPSWSSLVLH